MRIEDCKKCRSLGVFEGLRTESFALVVGTVIFYVWLGFSKTLMQGFSTVRLDPVFYSLNQYLSSGFTGVP